MTQAKPPIHVSSGKAPVHDDHDGHDHAHGGILGERTELYFAFICGALLAIGFIISKTTSLNDWVPRGLYIAAYFFGGYFTLKEAMEALSARKFQIDSLMLVAAAGAAALDAWAEGGLLLFLFSIGHALEQYAMGRAKRAIEALAELAPQTALVRRGDTTEEIAVSALQIGDIVVVKPNERLAADAIVIEG
ncbi:MAG: heavy metal translocating P-type ATPase, partial [Alphaproteobacteria bacterium PA3]